MVRYVSDQVGVMYIGRLVEKCAADENTPTPCTPIPRASWARCPWPTPG